MTLFKLVVVFGVLWALTAGETFGQDLQTDQVKEKEAPCQQFEDDWSPLEQQVWTSICLTGRAGVPVPSSPNYCVMPISVRGAFIKALLTLSPYKK